MLLLFFLGLMASVVHAIPTIYAKGSKFFTSDGNQYRLKGIAYQLLPDDPLIDNDQCTRDADLMKTLGANSIRVYHVDTKADHDGCMNTFANAGIYVWLDLDTFSSYIQGPGMAKPDWNQTGFEAYQEVMDTFHKYDNLGGFIVGNEVLTSPETEGAAPYVKAAASDMKAYRDAKGYRQIPVGYTAADIANFRPMLQNYLACGDNSSTIDFFGLNAYEWCGDATYDNSGYAALQKDAATYNIPIFFSETGCNQGGSRTFNDQAAIFGDEMADTWSGAIIYEWIQEDNHYGIVTYPSPTAGAFGRSGTPTPVSPDFENLSKQWSTLSPSAARADDYKPSLSTMSCPTTNSAWQVNADVQLPTIGYGSTKMTSSSSSSDSRISTSIASATGKAAPDESGAADSTPDTTTDTSDGYTTATSNAAASGRSDALAGPKVSSQLWVGVYAALCAVAGMFIVL